MEGDPHLAGMTAEQTRLLERRTFKPLLTNPLIKKLAIARLRLRNVNRQLRFWERKEEEALDPVLAPIRDIAGLAVIRRQIASAVAEGTQVIDLV
jgi:hypothetical protein